VEDVVAADIAFYQQRKNLHADDQASLEAQLLLPIKCLAYGVPSHTFINYFQMSKQYARECCKQFDVAIKEKYHKEYLRLPTVDNLKCIHKLHKAAHKVDGLFGSLDCSHTMRTNCPNTILRG
jgi:hypothetical protein